MADWSTADAWFADFIQALEESTRRRRQLWRERVEFPVNEVLARAFADETEQKLRYLEGQRRMAGQQVPA